MSIAVVNIFKITKEHDNTRDYPMHSFYMGLLTVRHSPSLLLLTLADSYLCYHVANTAGF